jgi:hypothetical protein
MVCLPITAAGGFRFTSLHSRAALCSATFRSIPFNVSPSLGNPRKSVSIHSIALIPTHRFIPLPFGFPAHFPEHKAKT